jgi:outer membrane protein OmpA-like peptidoglycan-associated protein
MNKITLYTVLSLFLFSTACTTINPDTGETEYNRAGTGALVGAATGAVAGVLIGDSKKATIIGAGVGGIAGAAVGNYMDKQEQALRQDLKGTGVEVQRVGDNIELSMPSSITFATNQSNINPQFYSILDDIGRTLSKYESTVVHIAGHTDNTGSAAYNQQLSIERANSVRSALTSRGVISERIVTSGHGESLPVSDNNTQEGRQKNRRVEITLQPLTV